MTIDLENLVVYKLVIVSSNLSKIVFSNISEKVAAKSLTTGRKAKMISEVRFLEPEIVSIKIAISVRAYRSY